MVGGCKYPSVSLALVLMAELNGHLKTDRNEAKFGHSLRSRVRTRTTNLVEEFLHLGPPHAERQRASSNSNWP